MKTFEYVRPETVDEAVGLLSEHGTGARLLAGGTDLVIEMRNHWTEPDVVIDLKRIAELHSSITEEDGWIRISAGTSMSDITGDPRMQERFPALVEAAVVVGSVQIRTRATLAGNICNGSPAADTAPPLLIHRARVAIAGPDGRRTIPLDDFILGPGKVALALGELVTGIELPPLDRPMGAAYTRLTRRRGTDLASITLCCGVEDDGVTRFAFGSVGPRVLLAEDATGELANPDTPIEAKAPLLDEMFAAATPSQRSLRASPAYRLAMLRVLGARALETAISRLGKETT